MPRRSASVLARLALFGLPPLPLSGRRRSVADKLLCLSLFLIFALSGASAQPLRFQMQPGDSLTFASDGVVEARNVTRDLFGFGRTCAISTQSAEDIARAASSFGQEDDITELTLQYAPAEVLHA